MEIRKKLLNCRFIRSMAEKKGTLLYTPGNCVFCGKCAKICATGSITINFIEKYFQINHDKCMRCGQCAKACPKSALKIEK